MKQEERIVALKKEFISKFKNESTDVFSSPGRIELLGNHTDHNNGKVLVSSVDLNILAATSKSDDNKITFYSQGFNPMIVSLDDLTIKESQWAKN